VVRDLAPVYGSARIFVAPTRFAAGVPLKILEAAAAGLPVVASHLLGRQLGWRDGHEILLADPADPAGFARACRRLYQDAALWQRIRDNALARVARDCDRTRFREALERALRRP
jgi:glycosyltransferase involved in cell wall biosynthesis